MIVDFLLSFKQKYDLTVKLTQSANFISSGLVLHSLFLVHEAPFFLGYMLMHLPLRYVRVLSDPIHFSRTLSKLRYCLRLRNVALSSLPASTQA